MTWLESLILGLVQGLTEYLPVSSSGHLEIANALFGIQGEENLTFAVLVHTATVCSTIVVLWKEVEILFRGLFRFTWNSETKYLAKIALSMIPVGIVGLFLKDYVESFFGNGLLLVGIMLLVTAALLTFAYYARPRVKEDISYRSLAGGSRFTRTFAFRYDYCDRTHAGKQKRTGGPILVSYGDYSYFGRGSS